MGKQLTFLDIFAGIGGMRRGLESPGHTCVGYIEWDKWARKSYEAIFDTKGEWTASDVTTVRASDLPRADIWTFGFPCQDLSVAGRQLGFSGNRSSLFFTVVDLVRNTEERDRPEWLIAENVMGFFSSNRGYDFLAAQVALDEIGYDVEWGVFNATQFGIPQNRQRIFLVGHSRRHGRREVFPLTRSVPERIQLHPVGKRVDTVLLHRGGITRRTNVSHCLMARDYKGIGNQEMTGVIVDERARRLTPLETWRLMGRSDDDFYAAKNAGVSDTQLYKQAGNSLIPQIAEAIGRRIAEVTA